MTSYSDGNARDVTAPANVVKGTPTRVQGWNGIYQVDALSGKLVAIETDPAAFHYFATPVAVGTTEGSIIYITPDGATLTMTSSSNFAFAKVDKVRDANGVVGGRILNIS